MLHFTYQIQRLQRGKWIPVCNYRSGFPMEFDSLLEAEDRFKLIRSNYENVRLVKLETHLILS